MIVLRSDRELDLMRRAGSVTGRLRLAAREALRPGIRTRELDAAVARTIEELGANSNFKGYHGFPATVCVSVNDEVIHGIPGERVIRTGDLVSVDLGAAWRGYQGDSAFTVAVGEVDAQARALLEATEAALWKGIEMCRPGNRIGDISHAIEAEASRCGLGVVRDFVGHGIGRAMHEEPAVPNYGMAGKGPLLRRGMVLAIEPMFTMGGAEVRVLDDGWTVVTVDGSLSAHFEHTVAVGDPPEVLTLEPAVADQAAVGGQHG